MIREFNPGTNDFDVFFEEFETVIEAGMDAVVHGPDGDTWLPRIRYIDPPTVVRLPYGALALADCEHVYVRGLIWHENEVWSCAVCRRCEHVAPPAREMP